MTTLQTPIKPIDESRDFAAAELFFSTTDLKGRIQRANGVFQRISGYSWDELNNRPHNIVRHPDMPRVVFQMLWDHIQAGRPVVAFIKNLAQDGRYYWVVALVVAIPHGYLSVRFKPTSPLLATVKDLYAKLKAVEASVESDSNDRRAAIAASGEVLDTDLHALGFATYDDFMQQVLKREMQSREACLSPSAHPVAARSITTTERTQVKRDSQNGPAELDRPGTIAEAFDRLVQVLNILFGDLEVYIEINRGVREKSETVMEISESLRVSALNGVIAVDKMGNTASGLRPVLDWLRVLSGEITQEGVRLSGSLNELVRDVDLVVFSLSAAKLQIEMTAQFAHELVDRESAGRLGDTNPHMTEGAIRILHASACETVRKALVGLTSIRTRLKTLTESQTRLLDSSHSLRPIYLTGRIEMAGGAGALLGAIFRDVGDQMAQTVMNLKGLKDVLQDLDSHMVSGLAHGEQVELVISRVQL